MSSLTNEKRSSEVRTWLGEQDGEMCTSDWVATEVAAAFAIKIRTGEILVEQRASLQAAFDRLQRDSLRHITFRKEFFGAAAGAASRPHPALRAGDALHLAICMHHRATLCTLDTDQARAAVELGLTTILL